MDEGFPSKYNKERMMSSKIKAATSRRWKLYNSFEKMSLIGFIFFLLCLSLLLPTTTIAEKESNNESNNKIISDNGLQKAVSSILPSSSSSPQEKRRKLSLLRKNKKQKGQQGQQQRLIDPRTVVSKQKLNNNNNNEVVGKMRLRKRYEKAKTAFTNNTVGMTFRLPSSAEDWCSSPKLPPLPYDQCKDASVINSIPLKGGLTNSLKGLLLGAILSFELDRCFVIDESESDLSYRINPEDQFSKNSFYARYFEPVGLSEKSMPEVAKTQRIEINNWTPPPPSHDNDDDNNNNRLRYYNIASSTNYSIPSLNLQDIDGHDLKRRILKQLWRPKTWVRDTACARLEKHLGEDNSQDDFMVLSVRRGDKKRENIIFPSMDKYITAAEQMIRRNNNNNKKKLDIGLKKNDVINMNTIMPTIFVATDDCSVVRDFRHRRPKWKFVSVCDDDEAYQLSKDGFRHEEMKHWNHKATDIHFGKFMVELYAMAAAKYFIGVSYTNVTWWALFMRQNNNDPSTFHLLKTPGFENRKDIDYW